MKKQLPVNSESETRDLTSHEFIPYACHYSPDTILTKSGELIQFIRITNNNGDSDHLFRENLRNAILSNVASDKFAAWLHLMRFKDEARTFDIDSFTQYIDFLWRKTLPQEIHFKNEIYLSVVIDSSAFEPWNGGSFIRSLSKKSESNFRNQELAKKNELLNHTTDKIIEQLAAYGAEKLGVYENKGIYYSEIMEFAQHLMGLEFQPMPLPMCDLSYKIKPDSLDFNTYTGVFKVKDKGNTKYGASLTLKQNIGVTATALQNILNCDAEYIISQSIDFAFGNRFLPALKDQVYINSISNDQGFLKSAKLADTSVSNPNDFALVQTNLSIIKSSSKELDNGIKNVQDNLQDLGVISYLEDINSERIYWANLPGNFAFLKRQETIPKKQIGSFTCFGTDKFSAVEDCLFGTPTAIFENQQQEIFSLHFLNNGQGHMLIVGSNEENRQVFANLIATNCRRLGAEIIFYDSHQKHQKFANIIEAKYLTELNLDEIASDLEGGIKIVILNSLTPILENNGHKNFAKFLDYAGSKNCIVICCEEYENNCELLLPNFTTTVFFPETAITEKYADNYDIFEDEKQTIENLNTGFLYARHGHEEITIKFAPTEHLRKALLEGSIE